MAHRVCTISADKVKATEGASTQLRAAVCTEQDRLKKYKTVSGQFRVTTTFIAFFTTMMALIIPAWVCVLVFAFGAPIIGLIGAIVLWDV